MMLDNGFQKLLKQNYSNSQVEEIKYVIKASFNDFSKFFLLSLPFASLGIFKEYFYATVVISILRSFTGGFHLNTYFSCLAFSLVNFSVILFAWTFLIDYSTLILLTGLPFATVLIYLSPMLTVEKKAAFNYERYNKSVLLFIVVGLIGMHAIFSDPIFMIGTLSIILLSIQHVILKGVQHNEQIRKEVR